MAFKRLPNNYGTIDKMPGSRRRPYRARKRIGKKDGKPVYVTIGYYEDKAEALKQLALANDETLVKEQGITFGECMELWKKEYKLTRELPKNIVYATRHLEPLVKRNIADLRAIDLESVINSDKIPRTAKPPCITILHGTFAYAMRHDIISKDYSTVAKYAINMKVEIERRVWTEKEIKSLWDKYGLYEKITLVQLYSGMRISEVIEMKTADTHLEDLYMVGGLKTDSGKNRIIPIHSTIYKIIKEFYEKGGEYLFEYRGKKISRRTATTNIKKYNHNTHDARHTFITQAYKCGIPEQDIKRIVGHSQNGVTQSVYMHLDNKYLCDVIKKLRY